MLKYISKKRSFTEVQFEPNLKYFTFTICLPQLDFQKNFLFGMDFGGKKRIEQRTVYILAE